MRRTRRTTSRPQIDSDVHTPLEPRVAKLEVGLDRLTSDVANLATVVREQGNQVESEIQKLVIAVTQAAGPRKTDWMTIITGIMLVMAIGSSVFWPLNQQVGDNRIQIEKAETRVEKSETRLESRIVNLEAVNTKLQDQEHDELMAWRQRAMGLQVVPPNAPKGSIFAPR